MTINNTTAQVTATKVGAGWTIDVTACNLSTDLGIKDFAVFFNDALVDNTNFTKTSTVTLTYTGSSIASTTVKVQRDTPITRIQELIYGDRMSSSLWENELNRVHKILTDIDQFGTGVDIAPDASVVIAHVESMAALKTIDVPTVGTKPVYYLRGYYSQGDGGGGYFYYDSADTTTTADDGLVVLVNGVSANGRWKRIYNGTEVNVKWFGAKGDGVASDSSYIQKAIDTLKNVFIPLGTYLISTPLDVTTTNIASAVGNKWGMCIRGEAKQVVNSSNITAKLIANTGSGKAVIETTGTSYLTLKDFSITTQTAATPSTIGLLNCRGATVTYNQQNIYENLYIYLQDNASANSANGAIAVWHYAAENCVYRNVTFHANLPLVITQYQNPGLASSFYPTPTYAAMYATSNTAIQNRFENCYFLVVKNYNVAIWANRLTQGTFSNCYFLIDTPTAGNTNRYLIKLIWCLSIHFDDCYAELPGNDGGTLRVGYTLLNTIGTINNLKLEFHQGVIGNVLDAGVNKPFVYLDVDSNNGGLRNSDITINMYESITTFPNPAIAVSAAYTAATGINIHNCHFTMPCASGSPLNMMVATETRVWETTLTSSSGTFDQQDSIVRGSKNLENKGLTQIRLTSSSTAPEPNHGVQSVTNALYVLPYQGDKVAIRRSNSVTVTNAWDYVTVGTSGYTIDTSGLTTSKQYDVFAYFIDFVTLGFETVQWTNTTTRATGISYANGIYYKTGDADRKYIGTFYLSAGNIIYTQTSVTDTVTGTLYHLYNFYNRIPLTIQRLISSTWSYNSATWREVGGLASYIQYCLGVGQPVVGHFYSLPQVNTTEIYKTGIALSVTTPTIKAIAGATLASIDVTSSIAGSSFYQASTGMNNQYLLESTSGNVTVNPNSEVAVYHNVSLMV